LHLQDELHLWWVWEATSWDSWMADSPFPQAPTAPSFLYHRLFSYSFISLFPTFRQSPLDNGTNVAHSSKDGLTWITHCFHLVVLWMNSSLRIR
jgi:hypothetical protein